MAHSENVMSDRLLLWHTVRQMMSDRLLLSTVRQAGDSMGLE